MNTENKNMTAFLRHHGIKARVKYFPAGSVRGWRVSDWDTKYTPAIRERLTAIGFKDYRGQPLTERSSNGGRLSLFLSGNEHVRSPGFVLPTGEPAAVINELVPDDRPQPSTEDGIAAAIGVIERARVLWRLRCQEARAKHGDEGTCVMGAGIAVMVIPKRARTARARMVIAAHEVSAGQGASNWERSEAEIVAFLRSNGLPSAFYECGRSD